MADFLTYVSNNPLLAVIAAGEVGFWVLLVAGLAARYLLRQRKASTVLLLCVPLVDLVILAAALIDLAGGAAADSTHGLAATYLGFSVAFGHSMVRWADQRFAHRFAGGPPPTKPPKYGAAKVRHKWREWGKFAAAWAISCGLMLLMILVVGSPDHTVALWSWIHRLSIILVVWFVGWPLRMTISPPRRPDDKHTDGHAHAHANGEK